MLQWSRPSRPCEQLGRYAWDGMRCTALYSGCCRNLLLPRVAVCCDGGVVSYPLLYTHCRLRLRQMRLRLRLRRLRLRLRLWQWL